MTWLVEPGAPRDDDADGDLGARARFGDGGQLHGRIVHIVSGLKTLLETGSPLVAA